MLSRSHGQIGLQVANEPNAYCWSELYVRDPDAARAFYGALFGWSCHESPGADGDPYYELGPTPARNVAGPMPASWTVYFQVADLDQSLTTLQSLGGTMVMPPMDVPEVGRFARVTDPTGAQFS
ncbi:MAG: VOC family protein [Nannocystaceae bacterium]